MSAGGIVECLRIAALAQAYGVEIYPHAWGTAACNLANYHFGFAAPNCRLLEYPTYGNPLRDELLVKPLRIVDGCLLPPEAPGRGVRLTAEIREKYRDSPEARLTMGRGS